MNSKALPQGARFGRYIIERVLGSGTFGVVYAARREDLPRLMALKVLHTDLTRNAEVVRRFHAEAHTISDLRHPHIVAVTDVGSELGIPFLAMELLEGETLRDRVERERALALDATLDLLFPIFSAVSAVHAKGVVHRDLKPDNIILAELLPGRVHPKLLDFGVAKVAQGGAGMTREGAAVGTPYYMSPEQAEEAREADAASDQWSLAVLLYRCITGHQPFEGRSVVKILHAIIEDAPPLPSTLLPTCPAVVERALLRALSKKPGDRFPSVRAFGAVLLPFASRRTREDWSEEFVDGEASTFDLEPAKPVEAQKPWQRRDTQSGPVFQPPGPTAMAPDLYEDDEKTDVKIGASAHDTIESGAPSMTAPIAPIAAVAPVVPATLVWGSGTAPMRTVAVPPPPAAPAVAPVAEPVGTLSHGAHSLSPLVEERRARQRVVAAGVFACVSVLACVYVIWRREAANVSASQPPPRRADGGVARTALVVLHAPPPTPEVRHEEDAGDTPMEAPAVRDAGDVRGRHGGVRGGVRGRARREAAPAVPTAVAPEENAHSTAPLVPPSAPVALPVPEPEGDVPERLASAQVLPVFRRATGIVQRCVAGRGGQVVVRVAITSEGVTTTTAVTGGMTLNDGERACVVEVLRGLRFPQSRRGSEGVPFVYVLRGGTG